MNDMFTIFPTPSLSLGLGLQIIALTLMLSPHSRYLDLTLYAQWTEPRLSSGNGSESEQVYRRYGELELDLISTKIKIDLVFDISVVLDYSEYNEKSGEAYIHIH